MCEQSFTDLYNTIYEKIHKKTFESTFKHYAVIVPAKTKNYWTNKIVIGENMEQKFLNYPSLHAEMHVISKLIKITKRLPKKIDIVVIKINKIGTLAQSRPCYHCIMYMKNCGLEINNVFYTTCDGVVREKLKDMTMDNSYISSGMRYMYRLNKLKNF